MPCSWAIRAATAALLSTGLASQADEPKPFHFAHDISPLLVKQACASAECHGAATGQADYNLPCNDPT